MVNHMVIAASATCCSILSAQNSVNSTNRKNDDAVHNNITTNKHQDLNICSIFKVILEKNFNGDSDDLLNFNGL